MSSKLADKNGENSNEHSRDLLRDSLEKMRLSTQKLMIYEVLSSQTSIFAALSASANCLSKRALGVEVSGLQSHPSSNLRAYSYILIQALTKGSLSQQTARGVAEKLDSLREKPPVLKNYTCAQKFRPGEMLEIFGAMQAKVADLLEGGLNLNEILKVHSCYLDLTAFFLRALLANVGMANSDDCGVRLPTSDVFSILSEYLDLSYIANKSVYLFPQIKYFIGSPDDVEFIFGKYYDNSEELKSNEFEIRQSTIDHINKGNEKYESMKISKINLDVTMSEFLFPEKLADLPGPCSSKAPTPEFGQNNYMGFEELLGYNSEEEAVNMSKKSPKESNEKETKPESNANLRTETEHEDELEKQPKHRESVFTKKVCVQEVMTPSANGKNVIGSAFYLHEFDFYHRSNLQNNEVTQKFCSERVLLKGSSMVEKGQLFLQQVGQLKKEIENQMMDRDRDRHHLMSSNDLHESVSIHNMGQSNERRSRNPSPKSHNAKSEAVYDNRSCNSGFSKPSPKNMGLNSYVYGLNIEADDLRQKHKRSSKDKGPVAPKSTSQNKSAKARQMAAPGPKLKPQLIVYHSPRIEKGKVGPKQVGFRASEAPESCGPKTFMYPNRNYNHIHIHIHNDGQGKQGQPKEVQPRKMEKMAARETDIHYEIKGTDLQHAFQSTIPKLIKQIENEDLYGSVKPIGPMKAPKFVSPTPKDYLARVHQLNNIDSEKYLMDKSHAQQDKLKKRKSEEGFQTISMELVKHPVVMKERIYYHVPSFLRKKEQPQDETTSNIDKSRDQKQGKPVNTHGTTRCSPQPVLASKERPAALKKEEKYNLNLRGGVMGKCSTDLETPTFGTPTDHRNSPKAYGKP